MARELINSTKVSENVRIQTYTISFAEPFDDVIVESLYEGQWIYSRGFNSISNDYAAKAAREYAEWLTEQVFVEN